MASAWLASTGAMIENYFQFFVRHFYFWCDGDTYSDVNIIAIERSTPTTKAV